MHEFAEEYVAKLQAREERYETRLGDDFYVSTFPNGVKTWIYLYEVNGFTRRQTLGVYPETPLDAALESLYAARRTRAVEQELMEQGLDGNSLTRGSEESPIDLKTNSPKQRFRSLRPDKRYFAGVGSGAIVALTVLGAVWLTVSRDAVPTTPIAAVTPASQPGAAVAAQASVADSAPDTRVARLASTTQTDQVIPAGVAGSEPGEIPAGVSSDAVAATSLADELGDSQKAVMALQRDLIGTLAWAQLTSGIKAGEPIDDLGWVIELERKPKRVFYFVRVRGMAGDNVVYRWSHEGDFIKEDTVRVGSGWHSPAYSSMVVTPDRTGVWHVVVSSPDGKVLGEEEFEARTPATVALSRR